MKLRTEILGILLILCATPSAPRLSFGAPFGPPGPDDYEFEAGNGTGVPGNTTFAPSDINAILSLIPTTTKAQH